MDEKPESPIVASVVTHPDASGDDTSAQHPSATAVEQPSGLREIVAVLLVIVLVDLTIYRGEGFAGFGLLFAVAPLLLLLGSPRPRNRPSVWIVGVMLVVLAARLVWCGSVLAMSAGFVLVVAFAMAISGLCPYVLEVVVFASQTILAGYEGLVHHWRSLRADRPPIARSSWLSFVLPLVTFVIFSAIFILANPDLLTAFGKRAEELLNSVRDWIVDFAPRVSEVLFWVATAWITVGLLRPLVGRTLFAETSGETRETPQESGPGVESPLYQAFRNTLMTVIALFAAYLVFEFKTLWFREFPDGFYYSGYAHEGAAWLTLGLALATVVLSLVFRGSILKDARLGRLRTLAWIWSLENMLLAVAVYNRLYIYIGFNGMTRTRIVGVFGMSAVVVGFAMVLWKIARGRGFIWLVRRHLWTLALAVYLFALTPVDTIVVSYNVHRIMAGDPAPSVQISVHPIDSEGVLLLQPLLECPDEKIREGVRAMLAQREAEAVALDARRRKAGWTAFQCSDRVVLDRLSTAAGNWSDYADVGRREEALARFHDYAYQWY